MNKKLTKTQVSRIRRAKRTSPKYLAKRYGVCLATIYNIRAQRTWKETT